MTTLIYVLMGLNGLLNVGNGLYMLYAPATWYVIVPTVTGTGPFNQHFIRDIGISHLLVGIGYLWGIAAPVQRIWMWGAATVWLTFHGIFHLWEIAVGICGTDVIAQNWHAVYLPAAVGLLGVIWAYAEPIKIREARA